ncbi:RNA polymerase sigma factor [Carboxylicivirga sp. M1479]|uniref:RNA polymerase sigma factor n=1 Tax=Carboxylicivirga sp. M1479 TaxID=2594476 RepID=UPI0011782C5F|nr:sigma-70 family RNA polymerase sigma factor [Carboxylicivirga sp. M1479]TRX65848.1 sigma-70 family RNA polymerase sigma factor [Carboxylicivirga sp. M1479]
MKKTTEEILILKSKAGNARAYGQLVERYSQFCFSIVFRLMHVRVDAEDVVQEAFISAWNKLKKFDPKKGKFSTWLYAIATRLAIDTIRKRKVLLSLSEKEMELQYTDPYAKLENEENEKLLMFAMHRLTELQKLVFVLREIEEMSVDEVVAISELTPKQIKDNLYVARKQVKQLLMKHVI